MSSFYPKIILSWILILFSTSFLFAKSEIDSLVNLANATSDQKQKAQIFYQLSTQYASHADYPNALSNLNKAFSIYNAIEDERNVIECYLQFGIIESFRGDYPRSANYFLRTLLYAEKHNDTTVLYAACINLTSVYSALENYKKAKYYLSKINVNDLEKDINLRVNYLGNKGQIEYELGNYLEAINSLEEGISIFDPNVPDFNLIQLLILTGDCAIKLNDIPKALSHYSNALKLAQQGEFPVQMAHIYYGLANVYKFSDKSLAINYANQSLELARNYEVLDLVANNHKLKSGIYSDLGNSKSALEEYKLYDIAIDSVFSMDSKDNIDLLEANFKVEKAKNDFEKLTLINDKNTLEKTIFLLVSIATLIVIVLLVISLRKRSLLNSKLKKSNLVKDKLLSIIAHDLKSPLYNISSVLTEIENNTFSKDEQSKIIQNLTSQTDITVETLENLLKWGQAQLRGIVINQTDFNLLQEIEKNIDLFQAQRLSKNISISVGINNDVKIRFDKDHFDFIIRNLIGNAIKFSYMNSNINIKMESTSKAKIKLIVEDFGTGIQGSDANSIFLPSPNIRIGTNNEKGSGLGLLLCKEFAEANNGNLSFFTEVGKGSEFYFFCNLAS